MRDVNDRSRATGRAVYIGGTQQVLTSSKIALKLTCDCKIAVELIDDLGISGNLRPIAGEQRYRHRRQPLIDERVSTSPENGVGEASEL